MIIGRSIVLEKPGAPLTVREMAVPEPSAGEVVVRVEMAGVCGTDVHRMAGDVPWSGGAVCFGHEAVGIVEIASPGAEDQNGDPLVPGDRIYWNPVVTCGQCAACIEDGGVTMRCAALVWPVPASSANASGFQELALVGPRSARYRVPLEVSPESVIAFGCAMPTAIAGFERLGRIEGAVVVQGCGPVGLACTVLAALQGADQVIVIGDPDHRLDVACRLGATATIPLAGSTPQERRERVLALTRGRGADIVIEAAGHRSAFPEGMDLLGHGGTLLVLGLYSGAGAASLVDPVRINNLNLTIRGSLGASFDAFRETVDLAHQHGEQLDFASLVTHRFSLAETEKAIAAAATGDAVKAVVVPQWA